MGQFAGRVASVEETPEPFRPALLRQITPEEPVRLIVCEPAFITMGRRRPSTVTVVTDRRWLIASDERQNAISVVSSSFDETLLVEMAVILLAGHLKIDFGSADSAPSSGMVEFNTVMQEVYREAVDLVLDGIIGTTGKHGASPTVELFADWPIKFRNIVPRFVHQGSRVLAATHWPSVIGGFERELAPEAALIATDHELLLVLDERAPFWSRAGHHGKFGNIATYFPLVRLAGFQLDRRERATDLDLEMHASHGGEKLHMTFPSDHEPMVRKVLDSAMSWKSGGQLKT
jgi:hypothetical protein